ncbi:nickel-binding protein [Acaryochloris sp. CCMEE 5410]|uniref:nickel-binding protein n=1 Tax=Acaryochloris sp. CCMEE 5410 TaxID=310037 RepID=UPI0011119227|nr:nickel-binding protein [Acaryochloris sp. CCMEE 5410]KAI9129194.1 DUF4242 domain-containing protein [Acaryochloris sp. CCMEE 5410]
MSRWLLSLRLLPILVVSSMSLVVVETTFKSPLHPSERADALPKCWPCLVQHNVTWVRSILCINRNRMINEFDAPDAETVRTLYHRVGVPFDRVWTGESFTPESISESVISKGEVQ